MNCPKCEDTGFVNRVSAIVKPPAMSRPAWDFWRPVLASSDFCDCRTGKDNLLVFRIESEPGKCCRQGCIKPAVFRLQTPDALCEVHALEEKLEC